MSNINHFKDYSVVDNHIEINLSFGKFEQRYVEAQKWLDKKVFEDMTPFMPRRKGSLLQRTTAENAAYIGSGKVVAGSAPYGRFLYMGKVMVDPVTGSPWARAGAKKVVTDRDLKFSQPNATAFWFDTAKAEHKDEWINGVKRILNG